MWKLSEQEEEGHCMISFKLSQHMQGKSEKYGTRSMGKFWGTYQSSMMHWTKLSKENNNPTSTNEK